MVCLACAFLLTFCVGVQIMEMKNEYTRQSWCSMVMHCSHNKYQSLILANTFRSSSSSFLFLFFVQILSVVVFFRYFGKSWATTNRTTIGKHPYVHACIWHKFNQTDTGSNDKRKRARETRKKNMFQNIRKSFAMQNEMQFTMWICLNADDIDDGTNCFWQRQSSLIKCQKNRTKSR